MATRTLGDWYAVHAMLCVYLKPRASFQHAKCFRPFIRRRASTLRPPTDRSLVKKPCLFFLLRQCGWYVRFVLPFISHTAAASSSGPRAASSSLDACVGCVLVVLGRILRSRPYPSNKIVGHCRTMGRGLTIWTNFLVHDLVAVLRLSTVCFTTGKSYFRLHLTPMAHHVTTDEHKASTGRLLCHRVTGPLTVGLDNYPLV